MRFEDIDWTRHEEEDDAILDRFIRTGTDPSQENRWMFSGLGNIRFTEQRAVDAVDFRDMSDGDLPEEDLPCGSITELEGEETQLDLPIRTQTQGNLMAAKYQLEGEIQRDNRFWVGDALLALLDQYCVKNSSSAERLQKTPKLRSNKATAVPILTNRPFTNYGTTKLLMKGTALYEGRNRVDQTINQPRDLTSQKEASQKIPGSRSNRRMSREAQGQKQKVVVPSLESRITGSTADSARHVAKGKGEALKKPLRREASMQPARESRQAQEKLDKNRRSHIAMNGRRSSKKKRQSLKREKQRRRGMERGLQSLKDCETCESNENLDGVCRGCGLIIEKAAFGSSLLSDDDVKILEAKLVKHEDMKDVERRN